MFEAVRHALMDFEGSYAPIVVSVMHPYLMFVACSGGGLAICVALAGNKSKQRPVSEGSFRSGWNSAGIWGWGSWVVMAGRGITVKFRVTECLFYLYSRRSVRPAGICLEMLNRIWQATAAEYQGTIKE